VKLANALTRMFVTHKLLTAIFDLLLFLSVQIIL